MYGEYEYKDLKGWLIMAKHKVVDYKGLAHYHNSQVAKKMDGDVAPIAIDRVLTLSGIDYQSDELKSKSYIDAYLYSSIPGNCRLIRVLPNTTIGFDISDGSNTIKGYMTYNEVTGTISCTIDELNESTASWALLSVYYYK